MNLPKLSTALCTAIPVLAGLGLSMLPSSQTPAIDVDPVSCGGLWFLQRTGEAKSGVLQEALDDAIVDSYNVFGTRIDWTVSDVYGTAGGFLYTDKISVQILSRPSAPGLSGLSPVDESEPAQLVISQVEATGHDEKGNFQAALDDAIASALTQFPGADFLINWSGGPVMGESSTSQDINDIYVTIDASLQGASASQGFADDAQQSGGAGTIVVIGVDVTGSLQGGLDNAIAVAKAQLETDHITYSLACVSGQYGDNGQSFVNRIYVYIFATPQ